MHITIDVSAAVNARAGLGRYAGTLAAEIATQHPGQVGLFANLTAEAAIPPELQSIPIQAVPFGYKPWRMAIWLGQMSRLGWGNWIEPTDLFHATEHLLMPLPRIPTILTVHDLIFHLFPEHHKKLNYWYLNIAMPLFARRANHLIAVSHSTKNDLIRYYGIPAEKITVIYEAAAPTFIPQSDAKVKQVRRKYNLPDRYILAVGTIEPRKNLARLVEALAALRQDAPALKLVAAGSEGWLTENFYAAIQQHDQADAVIRPGWVDDEDLPALYAGAAVVAQPSLYEGFGLPVLEAMAVGTPVVCSRTSSVGEIVGDAALTFDPHSVPEMVDALHQVLVDPALRHDLSQKGLARAAQFSWEKAARETWQLYEQVLADA